MIKHQFISRITYGLILLLSIPVAFASYRFTTLDLGQAFAEMSGHILNHKAIFMAHIIASPIALAIGVFQFSARLRRRFLSFHRWSGRAYGVVILVGSISGLYMAYNAIGGAVAGWGFGLLAVLWFTFTANAIRLAMLGDIAAHRRWMIRSYSMTFAAVALRLQLPFFMMGGMEYAQASIYVAWLCWVPNLLLVELFLRPRRRLARHDKGSAEIPL